MHTVNQIGQNDQTVAMVPSVIRLRRVIALLGAVACVVACVVVWGAMPAPATTTVVVVEGRGFGHGVGMAQDGAYWMGKSGRSAAEILRLFYPGTMLAKRNGTVRVPLLAAREVTVLFPAGGSVGSLKVGVGGRVRFSAGAGIVSATLAASTGADTQVLALSGATVHGSMRVPVRLLADVTPDLGTSTTTTTSAVEVPTVVSGGTDTITSPTTGVATIDPGVPTTVVPESSIATSVPPLETGGTSTAPAPPTVTGAQLMAAPPGGEVLTVGAKRYRGQMEITAVGNGVKVVNAVDVEQYLRGMGEVLDPRWPAAALQAQTIAARTFALRTMELSGEVCPTQRCQVYLGAQAEYPAMDAAVKATAAKVVTYQAELALTFYSASGGGTIADPTEVFGPTSRSVPYLQAGVYPTGDMKFWTVEVTLEQLGRRFGYGGTAQSVSVTQVGPSGRAVEITIDGTTGPRHIAGPAFDAALGLRSTNFTLRTGASATAPADLAPADPTADPQTSFGQILDAQTQLLATDASATLVAPVPDTTIATTASATTRALPRATVTSRPPAGQAAAARPPTPGPGHRNWLLTALTAALAAGGVALALRWALVHGEHHDD